MRKVLIAFLSMLFGSVAGQTSGTFSTQITKKYELGYALHIPEKSKTPKPLIVFLHGSGEKGADIELVKVHGPFKYLMTNKLDAFVLAPQCRIEDYWESESLYKLIDKIATENNVDRSRIYLTGLSMGAWGAWNLAFSHPEMFACLVPICGFVDRVPMIENCKIQDLPTRIFHGLMDDVVSPEYSISIYKKLKPCHNDIQLTLFDDANHDSWTRVYDDSAIYEWMFKQRKITDK